MIVNRLFFLTIIYFLYLTEAFSQRPSPGTLSEGLAARKESVGKKALYGFVNAKGKVRISFQFDTIFAPFRHGLAVVGINGKAGVINKKGKLILPFNFNEVGEISTHSIAVKNDKGFWGFYNHKGEKISDPQFQNFRYSGRNKIIVQQNGKWGLINDKGHILIEFNYKWVESVSDKHFRIWNMPVWSARTEDNKVLFSVSYDSLRYAGEGVYVYSIIGKKGLLNNTGNLISEAIYSEISSSRNNLIVARKEKYGVVDLSNKTVVPFEYDQIIVDSLYIRVMKKVIDEEGRKEEKWGLYSQKGEVLIKPKYSFLREFSEGLIAARREKDTWGYIDPEGNTAILFRYADAGNFISGRAEVLVPYSSIQKELPAVIDRKGDYVITPADYEFYKLGLIEIYSDNRIRYAFPKDSYTEYQKINEQYVRVRKDGKWGMVLTNGKEIVAPVYERVSDPSKEGLIVVVKEGKSGVIDSRGNFTIRLSTRFDTIFGFHEGFSKFKVKSGYGFINKSGDVYISPQYPAAGIMSDSMVNVKLRGKWAFLDYRENLKVQPYYEEVFPFRNGSAMVSENGLWNFVNKEGKKLLTHDFQKIERIFSGRYLLYREGKMGMADERGREILAPKYEYIKETGYGYVLVKRNSLWGVLDYKENFVIPIDFDYVSYEPTGKIFITGIGKRQQDVFIK